MNKKYEIKKFLDDADDWVINRVYIFILEICKKRNRMQIRHKKIFDKRNFHSYESE